MSDKIVDSDYSPQRHREHRVKRMLHLAHKSATGMFYPAIQPGIAMNRAIIYLCVLRVSVVQFIL
jgi:hypothetical protein